MPEAACSERCYQLHAPAGHVPPAGRFRVTGNTKTPGRPPALVHHMREVRSTSCGSSSLCRVRTTISGRWCPAGAHGRSVPVSPWPHGRAVEGGASPRLLAFWHRGVRPAHPLPSAYHLLPVSPNIQNPTPITPLDMLQSDVVLGQRGRGGG